MLEIDNKIKIDCINQRIDNMARAFLEMKNEIDNLKKQNTELKIQLGYPKKQETIIEKTDTNTEQWFDIVGWEGYYQISNLSNVKSLNREIVNCNGFVSRIKGKVLKHFYDFTKQKYYVKLNRSGKSEKFYIENLNSKINNKNVKFKYPNIRYRILQYDLNRKLVHQWNSFKELREQTPYNIQRISQCCRDKSKKYNNYYWQKVELPS